VEEALKKGYVDSHIWKVLVMGAAVRGKLPQHCLCGEEPPEFAVALR